MLKRLLLAQVCERFGLPPVAAMPILAGGTSRVLLTNRDVQVVLLDST
jgi:hypothetical protein